MAVVVVDLGRLRQVELSEVLEFRHRAGSRDDLSRSRDWFATPVTCESKADTATRMELRLHVEIVVSKPSIVPRSAIQHCE
jgi:hypothetical protein